MSATSSPYPTTHYNSMQRLLHWAMALIIHKSLGMTALVLVALRILYRAMVGVPAYTPVLGRINAFAAHLAHLMLYGLMLVMPFSGYIFSVAGGHDVPWFGLFEWPLVLPHRDRKSVV